MSNTTIKLYIVVMNLTDTAIHMFKAPVNSWQGYISPEDLEIQFGNPGFEVRDEVHGYIVPAALENEFEQQLDKDDRVNAWWHEHVSEEHLRQIPWQS